MKNKIFKRGFAIIAFLLLLQASLAIAGEKVNVEVKNYQGNEVRPDLDTAVVELTFSDIQNGSAHVSLSSPDRMFFSPTDFPLVEGTELMDSTLAVQNGKAEFDYMFPIRGDYRMDVELKNERGNPVGVYNLTVNIQENQDEIKNAIILIACLVLFGFIAGYLLAKRRNIYAV